MKKIQSHIVISFFLLFIFGFAGASLIKPDTDFSEKENRKLAQKPKFSLDRLVSGEFSSDYDEYLSDQFILRNQWISVKTLAERAAGRQDVNDIYFAKDDYLIEKHTGTFGTAQAQNNISLLASFLGKQIRALGSAHVKALIAPNSLEILSEKLPPFADAKEEEAYLQQIADTLPVNSFVDVRPVLDKHKDEYIYYRTDHHWTTLGAWYAYKTWAEEIGLLYTPGEAYRQRTLTDEFYGTVEAKVNCETTADAIDAWLPFVKVPYTLTFNHNQEEALNNLYVLPFLRVRDKYGVFFGGNQPLTEIETEAGSGRRLLVIKDSYANCFVPFAVQDFDWISMVDMRYFNERLSEYLEKHDFTDILFLYNASGFAEDVSLAKLAL